MTQQSGTNSAGYKKIYQSDECQASFDLIAMIHISDNFVQIMLLMNLSKMQKTSKVEMMEVLKMHSNLSVYIIMLYFFSFSF